jgi:hypothetical protein
MIKNINVVFGKPMKGEKRKKNGKSPKDSPFKKQSISSDTYPIGKSLRLIMPSIPCTLQKGVFKSTISLLLDIAGKTKDGCNTHKDLQVLRIREELHLQERPNGKVYLSSASYTLTNEEKRAIFKCLCGIRVPTGFSTNIKNLVSMSELKVSGYSTHDCHTI